LRSYDIRGDTIATNRSAFRIEKKAQADNRWIGWTVAMNVLELWVTDRFELICSAPLSICYPLA